MSLTIWRCLRSSRAKQTVEVIGIIAQIMDRVMTALDFNEKKRYTHVVFAPSFAYLSILTESKNLFEEAFFYAKNQIIESCRISGGSEFCSG